MNLNKLTFENVDGYIVTSEHNRYYFTGFHSSFGLFIATKNKAYYITDSRYGSVATDYFAGTGVEAVILVPNTSSNQTALDILKKENVKVLGFEDNMSVREFEDMKSNFENIEFVAKGEYFELLRSVKSEEEVKKIAYAMQISSDAFNEFITTIKAGMTEKEICAKLNYQLYKHGADSLAFDTIVASGTNGAHPHAVPSDRVVQKGELVTLDFGARVDGYCADITRTIAFSAISEELENMYNTVLEAQEIGVKNAVAGASCKEVDAVVREFFKSRGMLDYFVHSLGHCVGVEIHEEPRLSKTADRDLENNMVVTVEPGLYIPNLGGVRIEDTVVINGDEAINLAKITKKLITISK